jgi:hypothetical protein
VHDEAELFAAQEIHIPFATPLFPADLGIRYPLWYWWTHIVRMYNGLAIIIMPEQMKNFEKKLQC